MKAAICYEFGKPLVIEEVQIDPPQTGEVKIKLAATAICHSDIHLLQGEWGGEVPVIAGHESSGIVESVGADVTAVKPGDRVVVSLLRSCGRCFFCTIGEPWLCSGEFALNKQSRVRNQAGQPILQGVYTGSFAEYTIVDQSQCVKIPDAMTFAPAALLACGVITGLGAVTNSAQIAPRSSVVVIGAAMVGARQIIAIDRLDEKLAAAQSFGATHVVNGSHEDAIARVLALSGGMGVDYALVTVGSSKALEQGFAMIRPGGTAVMVGISRADDPVSLPIRPLTKGRKLIGSRMGSTHLSVDVPRLVEFYLQGKLKLDELITRRYRLDEINEAIASTESGEALRNVILFK
jgi:S-(hydroxymethyl)glutathione dehydrogenase / alcohol dehydrogenase